MRSSVIVRTMMGVAIAGAVAVGSSSVASAADATGSLAVGAGVTGKCTIATAALAFGDYDPVGAHAAADLDAQGSVTITCTKNAVATIGLGVGANENAGQRRMKAATADYLEYELYSNAGRSVVWDEGAGLLAPAAAPSKDPRVFPVYGRILRAQDAAAGNYTDSVTATVNF